MSLRYLLLYLSLTLCWLGSTASASAELIEEGLEPEADKDTDTQSEPQEGDDFAEGVYQANLEDDSADVFTGHADNASSVSPLKDGFADESSEMPLAHSVTLPQWEIPAASEDVQIPGLAVLELEAPDLERVDIERTDLKRADLEISTPEILTPEILDPEISNPEILSLETDELETKEDDIEARLAPALDQTLPLVASELVLSEFTVFPVGIDVGDRNVLPTTLIKGSEGGSIAFEEWLIPFDSVTQALGIHRTVLEGGEWELRSAGFTIRLNPTSLQTDRDLGLVLSVAQVQTLLGVPAQFDQLDYAIRFTPTWSSRDRAATPSERPIVTEGLPAIAPAQLGVSGVAQTLRVAGQSGRDVQTQGNFSSLGTAFGGSWYLRTEQSDIGDLSSWRLREFQYLRQNEATDVALGSQPTFWSAPSGQSRDYWGATYVRRWGFEPPEERSTGGFNPSRRLQAAAVGRTVVGEAAPGTLAQLTSGLQNTVVDEILVDSSGVYRFENVVNSRGGGRYQVLLYPNGQLTALPEVRSASFSALPGQLPKGSSAVVVSGGFTRQTSHFGSTPISRSDDGSLGNGSLGNGSLGNGSSGNSFLGDFSDFRGGVYYQRGLTESFTAGIGLVQDNNPQALAEAFYAPSNLPLKIAVSALSDLRTAEISVAADVQYRPSRDVYMNFNSDRFSQRFSTEWRVAKGLTLLARGNTRDDAIAGGARFAMNNRDFYMLGNATIDTRSRLRWNLSSRKGALGLRHFGNETTTQSEVFYNLSGNYAYGDGHGLLLNYDTHSLNGSDSQFGTVSWRYRSARRASDGRPVWDAQLGYGTGSSGSGIVASLSTAVLPGIEMQARYRSASAFSDQDTFQIEFRPRLNFQGGISPASQYQDRLRTQGGMMLQPFLDANNNGIRDRGESVVRENLDLLLSVNYEDLSQYRPDIRREGAFITLPPNMYRVDVDPAGYPLDWQASETAYAVDTTAGQYTPVEIPLTRAYAIIGTVMNEAEDALAGQRVEAVEIDSERRQLSITNAAGVFYLERLPAGRYRFEVDGRTVTDEPVTLDESAEAFREIDFYIFPDSVRTQQDSPAALPEASSSEDVPDIVQQRALVI